MVAAACGNMTPLPRELVSFVSSEIGAERCPQPLMRGISASFRPCWLPELVCDGALLSTPAGSTAYNYSAHGPILPIGAEILAMTAMSAFRPRRWRGALLPESAHVRIDVLESEKRPVTASADSKKAYDILSVDIFSAPDHKHRILFDPGHGLEERLLREQFV